MFYNCDGLTQIQLDGLDTKNVKNAEQMFYGCSSLSNLDLSKLDFSKTEEMNSIFNGMESLEEINIEVNDKLQKGKIIITRENKKKIKKII